MKIFRVFLQLCLALSFLCFVFSSIHAEPIKYDDVDSSDPKAEAGFFKHCNDVDDDEYKSAAVDFWSRNGSVVFGCLSEPIEVGFLNQSRWFKIAYQDSNSVGIEYKAVCVIKKDDQVTPCSDIENKKRRLGNEHYVGKEYAFHILNNVVEYENLTIRENNVIDYATAIYNIILLNSYHSEFQSFVFTSDEQKNILREIYAEDAARKLQLFDSNCSLPSVREKETDLFDIRLCIYRAPYTHCLTRFNGGLEIHDISVFSDGAVIVNAIERVEF